MEDSQRSLIEHFSDIKDPRILRTQRHKLIDIIVIGVVGILCGADGWEEIEMVAEEKKEWLSSFLELPNGIPSHDTIARVFSRISPAEFEKCFSAWMHDIVELTLGEIVAIDGKRLRRSFDKASGKAAIHMVSAWAVANGVVMGQVKVDDKSNEITAIPKLLSILEVSGCIVTIDAMGCQKDIAEEITKSEADYVFGLKGNQGNTLKAVEEYFEKSAKEIVPFTTTDADHGRVETRSYQVASAEAIYELCDWVGAKSIAMVTSTREIGATKTSETRYYISSLNPAPEIISKAIRGHWGIENSLHWVLDVEFDEDRSRVRKDKAPENFAILRHMAINLFKREKTFKGSTGKKRLKCCMSNDYLAKVLFGAN